MSIEAARRYCPRPIALGLAEIDNERDLLGKYVRALEVAEETVKYLALCAFARYLELRTEGDPRTEERLVRLRSPSFGDWVDVLLALDGFLLAKHESLFGASLQERISSSSFLNLLKVADAKVIHPAQPKLPTKASVNDLLKKMVTLRNRTKGHGKSPRDGELTRVTIDALVELLHVCRPLLAGRPLVFIQEIRYLRRNRYEVSFLPLVGTEEPIVRSNDRVEGPGVLEPGDLYLWDDRQGAPLQLSPLMHYDQALGAVFFLSGFKGLEPEYASFQHPNYKHRPDRLLDSFRERAAFLLTDQPGVYGVYTGTRPQGARDAYELAVRNVVRSGVVTDRERELLTAMRSGLMLTEEDVHDIHEELGFDALPSAVTSVIPASSSPPTSMVHSVVGVEPAAAPPARPRSADRLQKIFATKKIRCGCIRHPPLCDFIWQSGNAVYGGFYVELCKLVCATHGLAPDFVPVEWSELEGAITGDQSLDCVLSVFETRQRMLYADFTATMHCVGVSGIVTATGSKVTSTEDLQRDDVRIIVTKGEIGWEYAVHEIQVPKRRLSVLDTSDLTEMVGHVASRRADVAICDDVSCARMASEEPHVRHIFRDAPLYLCKNSIMIPKGQAMLGRWLQQEFREARKRPEINQLESELLAMNPLIRRFG